MFGHGVSIALLFALSDCINRKTGSLRMEELGGLAKAAPKLAFLFGLAGMASIGLPGLANFAGEAAVFLSGFKNWTAGESFGPVQIGTIIAIFGVVLSAIYMLRAIRSIFHGEPVKATESASDLEMDDKVPAIILAARSPHRWSLSQPSLQSFQRALRPRPLPSWSSLTRLPNFPERISIPCHFRFTISNSSSLPLD